VAVLEISIPSRMLPELYGDVLPIVVKAFQFLLGCFEYLTEVKKFLSGKYFNSF